MPQSVVRGPAVGIRPGSGRGLRTAYLNGTKDYHREDCRRVEANPKVVRAEPLETAGKTYWPCPECRPPVRKRTTGSEPLGRVR